MWNGIRQWWSCNWPTIVAVTVAALLGIILLEIVTGGAVTAALPVLLQILATVLIGVAVLRAASYVGEYLHKGWEGDIDGGGKSLARALAIGAVELIFAILFGLSMDYEIFLNHTVPDKNWNVYLQENHINATRQIITTAMAYALVTAVGTYAVAPDEFTPGHLVGKSARIIRYLGGGTLVWLVVALLGRFSETGTQTDSPSKSIPPGWYMSPSPSVMSSSSSPERLITSTWPTPRPGLRS